MYDCLEERKARFVEYAWKIPDEVHKTPTKNRRWIGTLLGLNGTVISCLLMIWHPWGLAVIGLRNKQLRRCRPAHSQSYADDEVYFPHLTLSSLLAEIVESTHASDERRSLDLTSDSFTPRTRFKGSSTRFCQKARGNSRRINQGG